MRQSNYTNYNSNSPIKMLKHPKFIPNRPKQYLNSNFNPQHYSKYGLPEFEIVILKQIFDGFDNLGKGYVGPNDLKRVLSSYNFNPQREYVYEILSNFDENLQGKVYFEDFISLLVSKKRDKQQQLKRVFNMYDRERKGYINIQDLYFARDKLGENIQNQQVKQMMQKIGQNNKISWNDFEKAMIS